MAQHDIITRRYMEIQKHFEQLEQLVGIDEAMATMIVIGNTDPDEPLRLTDVRAQWYFDIPLLAEEAKIEELTAYKALLGEPIAREEAQKI